MKKKAALGKGIATLAAAVVCSVLIVETHGEHGVGWFVLAVVCIW